MQYPIIDNLIYAYLKNGWTGLNVKPINIWDELTEVGGISSLDGEEVSQIYTIRSFFIPVSANTSYYLHCTFGQACYLFYYTNEKVYIRSSGAYIGNVVLSIPDNCGYLRIQFSYEYGIIYRNDTSINYPATYTSYITNEESENHIKTFKKDIAHRLKLPMIHYFPHPVIDALISAADGQHTEEEKEILRHYLTPLGIGGI